MSRCPEHGAEVIPDSWFCDGENDCPQGLDEKENFCASKIQYYDARKHVRVKA